MTEISKRINDINDLELAIKVVQKENKFYYNQAKRVVKKTNVGSSIEYVYPNKKIRKLEEETYVKYSELKEQKQKKIENLNDYLEKIKERSVIEDKGDSYRCSYKYLIAGGVQVEESIESWRDGSAPSRCLALSATTEYGDVKIVCFSSKTEYDFTEYGEEYGVIKAYDITVKLNNQLIKTETIEPKYDYSVFGTKVGPGGSDDIVLMEVLNRFKNVDEIINDFEFTKNNNMKKKTLDEKIIKAKDIGSKHTCKQAKNKKAVKI